MTLCECCKHLKANLFLCHAREHQTSNEASNAVRVTLVHAILSSALKLVLIGSKQASLVFKHPDVLVCFTKCRQERTKEITTKKTLQAKQKGL